MKAIVVYESVWGNTAQVAEAVAAGIGSEARALPAAQVPEDLSGVELLVAGPGSLPSVTHRTYRRRPRALQANMNMRPKAAPAVSKATSAALPVRASTVRW
jgi:hypothetical protein